MLAALIAAFIVAAPAAADARHNQDYPWCALLFVESIRDCSYDTIEQCRATVSGVGGLCQRNLVYSGRPPKPQRYYRGFFHW